MIMQRRTILILMMLGLTAAGLAQTSIKIACIGNSITAGHGIPEPKKNAYPAQLQAMLGSNYEVTNYGINGSTLLRKGDKPYWQSEPHQRALKSLPDIVFIKLGTNDSKLKNRGFSDEFEADYRALVQSFAGLSSHPRIILLLPVTAFTTDTNGIYDPVIVKKIIPPIERLAYSDSLEIIDLHSLFAGHPELVPDKVHPNMAGATLIASRLRDAVLQKMDTAYNIFNRLQVEKKISSFHGFRCADFTFNGRSCKVVQPKQAAPGHPWVFFARFWGLEPQTDLALLQRGFHIVYCDVVELYGNREAITAWNDFYKLLHKAGLSEKTVLEGASRGGVYVYNWAAANPKKIACIYADNPVLDLKSWPGGKGKGPGSKGDWEKVKIDYKLTTDEDISRFAGSPINKIKKIVKGKYPMLHVLADADEVVPPEENTIPFEQAVKALNGNITVIHKPGFKHHPHSLPDPTPVVDFILKAVDYKN